MPGAAHRAPMSNCSLIPAHWWQPPPICKDEVGWPCAVGANVSGLRMRLAWASGRDGDARVAGLLTRSTARGRFVRQPRAPPLDGGGHPASAAQKAVAVRCSCLVCGQRTVRLGPGQHRPGPAGLAASATVATLPCARASRRRNQALRRSSRCQARRCTTHHVAIANSRLIAADNDSVTFQSKEYRFEGRDRHKTMTLAPDEFIRRFLLHVLPKGFHRIRNWGSSRAPPAGPTSPVSGSCSPHPSRQSYPGRRAWPRPRR